jgi:hypothetical protein
MSIPEKDEFVKFTSKTNEFKSHSEINDLLNLNTIEEDRKYQLTYFSRAQAIEMCIEKLGLGKHDKLIKDNTTAANCLKKVGETYNLMLKFN